MKKYLFIVLLVVISSCSSDDSKSAEEGIVGKWKLMEQYSDPGDGSGDFQTINSNRVIQFLSDGTIEINGSLCFMASDVGDVETGTYVITSSNEADTTFDGEIIPNTCSSRSARVYFDLPKSGKLVLWYPCIEGCAQKFSKI